MSVQMLPGDVKNYFTGFPADARYLLGVEST